MAATNKSELLDITRKDFAKVISLIETVTADQALKKDEDDTSIKDIIGHRAHWIELFLGWYADGQKGKTVYFPAKGYKWNELRRYNAEIRRMQASMSWGAAIIALTDGYTTLIEFIEAHSDADLYGGPMKGANNDWPTGRWAEAAGPSHFRSAAKYIRARLRAI